MGSNDPAGLLLERDDELRRLDETLDHSDEGRGGVTLIEGQAGIGKSALLAYVTQRAKQRGFLILEARGDELEQSFPFGIAIDLIAEPVARLKERDPTFGSGAAELAMIEPLDRPGTQFPAARALLQQRLGRRRGLQGVASPTPTRRRSRPATPD